MFARNGFLAPVIMVVEDDESVLEVIQNLLERKGFRVITAASENAAVILEATYAGEIALLLADVVLESGSGPDIARHLRSRRPSVTVLYMSGHLADTVLTQEDMLDAEGFVAKPFTLQSMLGQVEFALKIRADRDLDRGTGRVRPSEWYD